MVALKRFCTICTFCTILVGCITPPTGDFCAVEHPTRLTSKTIDAMTDAEVVDALAHNRKGEKLCGWKP